MLLCDKKETAVVIPIDSKNDFVVALKASRGSLPSISMTDDSVVSSSSSVSESEPESLLTLQEQVGKNRSAARISFGHMRNKQLNQYMKHNV